MNNERFDEKGNEILDNGLTIDQAITRADMLEDKKIEKENSLTNSQKRYFKSRIDFKTHRYWVKGLPVFRTKKLILEALRFGLTISCKSKINSEFHTMRKGGLK